MIFRATQIQLFFYTIDGADEQLILTALDNIDATCGGVHGFLPCWIDLMEESGNVGHGVNVVLLGEDSWDLFPLFLDFKPLYDRFLSFIERIQLLYNLGLEGINFVFAL